MTMIEKVANAICKRRNANDWPCNGLDFDEEMARVAIEAMREPTDEMIIDEEVHWDYNCHVCGGVKNQWQRMIDAALKMK